MIVTFVFLLLTNRHEFFEVLSRVIPSYGRIHKALDRFSKNSYIYTTKGKQNQKVLTYFETPKFQFTLNQYKIDFNDIESITKITKHTTAETILFFGSIAILTIFMFLYYAYSQVKL